MDAKQHATKKQMGHRKIKYTVTQKSMEGRQSSSKREVYSNTSLPEEIRQISNKQPTLHLKDLEKEEQTKPNVSRRK